MKIVRKDGSRTRVTRQTIAEALGIRKPVFTIPREHAPFLASELLARKIKWLSRIRGVKRTLPPVLGTLGALIGYGVIPQENWHDLAKAAAGATALTIFGKKAASIFGVLSEAPEHDLRELITADGLVKQEHESKYVMDYALFPKKGDANSVKRFLNDHILTVDRKGTIRAYYVPRARTTILRKLARIHEIDFTQ